MKDFFDRERELGRLRSALKRKSPQLIVIYGRRRCGKSTLIQKLLSDVDIYYLAQQTQAPLQLSQFAEVIGNVLPAFAAVTYPGWDTFFSQLALRLKKRTVLCIDEFPYMVSVSPELPSVIQSLIDRSLNKNLDIILCGSSQQMMQGLVLEKSAPLFGRATEILKIGPLEPGWIQDALGVSAEDAIREYSVWGGIPRYWELRQEYSSFNESIKNLLLDKHGVLNEEPARLLLDELRVSVQMNSILSTIGMGCHRLSEIAGRLQLPPTQLSRPLSRLIEMGYVQREIPFGESLKSQKRSLYKIADPLLRFYYRFVIPHASLIELGLTDQVFKSIQSALQQHIAEEWESMCRRAVPVGPLNGIQFGPALRWWGPGRDHHSMEADLIAESADKTYILVGECKWSSVANVERNIRRLELKAGKLPFIANQNIVPVIFAKSITDGHPQVLSPEHILRRLKR